MKITLVSLIAALVLAFSTHAFAERYQRSYHAKKIFKTLKACPATGGAKAGLSII